MDDRLVVKNGFDEYSTANCIEYVRLEGGQTLDYSAMVATAGDDTRKGGYGLKEQFDLSPYFFQFTKIISSSGKM